MSDAIVTASLYEASTGRIIAVVTGERSRLLDGPPPAGHGYVLGKHDGTRRRVNPQTLAVEAVQPPAPDSEHEWDAESEEWVLPRDAALRRSAKAAALAQIESLEKQQSRALREQAIGRGGTPAQLKKRLEDIDDQIAALRAQLA
jgi:hypothetical protein